MDFEDEEPLERTFNELCDELCLQNSERVEAWEKYRTVWSNYSLDGEPMQWLVCSLFDCVKQRSHAETSGTHLSDISSGMLSLSRLLKLSGVTLMQFFHRMRQWVNMVDMSTDFKSRMMMLERQFSITAICFRKMTVVFPKIFRTDVSDDADNLSNAGTVGNNASTTSKSRQKGGASATVKAFYPTIADDLVNCHLLLLVTIDWLYMVCLSDKNSRSDLLNPQFAPRDRSSLSILEDLCELAHASCVNAKVVQANYFRASLERLFEEKILTGINNFYLSLETSDFDHSSLHLNSTYEMFVLSDGDLDERILLSDVAEKEVGAPIRGDCRLLLDEEASRLNPRLQRVLAGAQLRLATEDVDIVQQFANPDKLLLQGYKGDYLTPTIQAQGVARLQALLAGRRREFGEATLSKMRQYCSGTAPWDDIRAQVNQLRSNFLSAYDLAVTEADVNRNEMQRRANLTETLFYITLDAILTCEADKVPDEDQLGVRLSSLLSNRTLLACLFAACSQ
uniref:DUF3452 domain-containing protein n=1 Tax=Macrostomum lignano TaxID=282301 RepID=A0A1I8G641_9PLAT